MAEEEKEEIVITGNRTKVKCTECGLEFPINKKSAQVMMLRFGHIPCKRCRSSKTEWDKEFIK